MSDGDVHIYLPTTEGGLARCGFDPAEFTDTEQTGEPCTECATEDLALIPEPTPDPVPPSEPSPDPE